MQQKPSIEILRRHIKNQKDEVVLIFRYLVFSLKSVYLKKPKEEWVEFLNTMKVGTQFCHLRLGIFLSTFSPHYQERHSSFIPFHDLKVSPNHFKSTFHILSQNLKPHKLGKVFQIIYSLITFCNIKKKQYLIWCPLDKWMIVAIKFKFLHCICIQRRFQQRGCSQVLTSICVRGNWNFGERSKAHVMISTPLFWKVS